MPKPRRSKPKANPTAKKLTTPTHPAIDRRKYDGNRVSRFRSSATETRTLPSPVQTSEEEYHNSPGFRKVQEFNNQRLNKYIEDFVNSSNAASDVSLRLVYAEERLEQVNRTQWLAFMPSNDPNVGHEAMREMYVKFLTEERDKYRKAIALSNGSQRRGANEEAPLPFEEVWQQQNGWMEQLQRVIGKLLELKLLQDRIWIGTRTELGFFIRDAKAKKFIAGRYQYKRIFEAGLSIQERDEEGRLIVKSLLENEIKGAHDTARDDNPAYKRNRTPESTKLQSFLESLTS